MKPLSPRVLIIDDDPLHLDIYGMLVKRAGYVPVTALVRFSGIETYPDGEIGLVLLDYRLNSTKTAREIGIEISAKYPAAPIVLLSDSWAMPPDIAPHVSEFIRKGEPEILLKALQRLLTGNEEGSSHIQSGSG